VKGFAGTFYITWQKVLPAGMKKVCKDKTFNALGCRCFLFARNPEIFSGIRVGKRMEWWIIPKGNLMKVAATGDGMYRTA
jgi:hypothetical protein